AGPRGEILHDGERCTRAESTRPYFPGLFPSTSFHLDEGRDQPERHQERHERKLAPGGGGELELIETAHCGERYDGRADGAPRDGGGVGEEIQNGRPEGGEPKAHHHGARDGHWSSEAGGPLDDRPERKGDQENLQPPIERDVRDGLLHDLELSG